MTGVVVDTDVYSYVFKSDSRGALYDKHLAGRRVHLCFATVAELYRWTVIHQWGRRRIDDLLASLGNCIILPYDERLAWEWARVMSIKGHPMNMGDAWIAAAALRHGLPLVTHNRKDFEHVPGLTVISEA